MGEYIRLQNLEIYKISRGLSVMAWDIYGRLNIGMKIAIGRQFLELTDSIGANIAEGYGRYHYLDKIKFYYYSRGSLSESGHWVDILFERKLVSEEIYQKFKGKLDKLHFKLNAYIKTNRENKQK